jgi:uncharacterized protein (DUF2252 family)
MRGNTDQFYDWVENVKVAKTFPSGPPVWICGDCHTGNLGPVADLKGNIDIQIRDLDQTVIEIQRTILFASRWRRGAPICLE